MKKKICGALFVIGLILVIGIVGGTECGEPLSNLLWCIPIMFVMWVLARVGRLFD